jgi:hypothetical protein
MARPQLMATQLMARACLRAPAACFGVRMQRAMIPQGPRPRRRNSCNRIRGRACRTCARDVRARSCPAARRSAGRCVRGRRRSKNSLPVARAAGRRRMHSMVSAGPGRADHGLPGQARQGWPRCGEARGARREARGAGLSRCDSASGSARLGSAFKFCKLRTLTLPPQQGYRSVLQHGFG